MTLHYEFETDYGYIDYDFELDEMDTYQFLYETLENEGMEKDKIDDYVEKHFDELCDKYYDDALTFYEDRAYYHYEEEMKNDDSWDIGIDY